MCTLLEKIINKSEEDYEVAWLEIDEFEHLLFHDHHIWAVNEILLLGCETEKYIGYIRFCYWWGTINSVAIYY